VSIIGGLMAGLMEERLSMAAKKVINQETPASTHEKGEKVDGLVAREDVRESLKGKDQAGQGAGRSHETARGRWRNRLALGPGGEGKTKEGERLDQYT